MFLYFNDISASCSHILISHPFGTHTSFASNILYTEELRKKERDIPSNRESGINVKSVKSIYGGSRFVFSNGISTVYEG